MKYDDYKWHIGDDFPKDLHKKAALIHIGMFMGWIIDNHLEGDLLRENFKNELEKFRKREITGAKFIELCCDFKLVSDDLNEEANEFAKNYYASDDYIDDYIELSDDENETIFHEPDTWEKYDSISKLIQKRYEEWKVRNL